MVINIPFTLVRSLGIFLDHWTNHGTGTARPTQSSIFILLISGISIFLLRVSIPKLFAITSEVHDSALPLQTRYSPHGSRNASHKGSIDVGTLIPAINWSFFTSVVLAICVRCELFRLVLDQQQCKIPGLEVSINFLAPSAAFIDNLSGLSAAFLGCL